MQKPCYSKHIKTEKNPQVVKHVVKPDFHGDGYLPFPLCGASAGRRNADELSDLFSAIIFGRFFAAQNSKLNA